MKCVVYVDGVCKSSFTVGQNPLISFVLQEEIVVPIPTDQHVYTKASEITPYFLFTKDIEHKYNIPFSEAKENVADILWPDSDQKVHYHSLASQMKNEIRRKGWVSKAPVHALSEKTCQHIENILNYKFIYN